MTVGTRPLRSGREGCSDDEPDHAVQPGGSCGQQQCLGADKGLIGCQHGPCEGPRLGVDRLPPLSCQKGRDEICKRDSEHSRFSLQGSGKFASRLLESGHASTFSWVPSPPLRITRPHAASVTSPNVGYEAAGALGPSTQLPRVTTLGSHAAPARTHIIRQLLETKQALQAIATHRSGVRILHLAPPWLPRWDCAISIEFPRRSPVGRSFDSCAVHISCRWPAMNLFCRSSCVGHQQ